MSAQAPFCRRSKSDSDKAEVEYLTSIQKGADDSMLGGSVLTNAMTAIQSSHHRNVFALRREKKRKRTAMLASTVTGIHEA